MALRIDELRSERSTRDVFISTRRLLLTADDEVVGEDDPRGISLLVGAGSSISMRVAERYGLVRVRPVAVEVLGDGVVSLDIESDALERERGLDPVPGQLVAGESGDVKRHEAQEDKASEAQEDKSRRPDGDKSAGGAGPASDSATDVPEAFAFLTGNAHEAVAGVQALESSELLTQAETLENGRRGGARRTVAQAIAARRAELAG